MKFDAVLFDCDGVLVDSEPITNGVLRDMLEELGWRLDLQTCMEIFVGKAVLDERARIEAETGRPVTPEWMAEFRVRRNAALEAQVGAIAGAVQAVAAVHASAQGRIACASGADRVKVEMQLQKVGLWPYLQGRVFSGHEMPRSKPHPDVYLAAAQSLGVPAGRCAVVEDTATGIAAGVAAGATVFAYAPAGQGDALRQAGAHHVFTHMDALHACLLGADLRA
ncbi:HAD family phosphatase [uncultured Rhodoferax sp.]|uniref:HAD family hydrolase n=1 Tax=uncultured Rhodoferax sp. TaxID=223188 RepID=UPI0025D92212|nr:HAD family phosphatase [uncultured Rhodoferax sp.]